MLDPLWSASMISEAMPEIEASVPASMRPKMRRGELALLGCGNFGCVYATHSPSVVMKLTTDDTEVEFAQRFASELVAPVCVRYRRILRLGRDVSGRAVHLLWRDAAADVGRMGDILGERAITLVAHQSQAAAHAYIAMRDGYPLESRREWIRLWREFCLKMAAIPELQGLGAGLVEVFDRQSILFADARVDNLGRVRKRWVITDPGQVAVVLDKG